MAITDIQQAAIFDLQEKVAETHELLKREKEYARYHQELMERRLENTVRIGQNLIDFKATLPHGKFMTWMQAEFRMSQPTAWRYMNLAEQAANHSLVNDLDLSPHMQAELAMPSMPATVIEMVETGQIPRTVAAIREAKREVLEQQNTTPIGHSQEQEQIGILGWRRYHDNTPFPPTATVVETRSVPPAIAPSPVVEDAKEKRDAHVMRVMGSSDSPEWYTPAEIVRLSIACLGEIDLDPCSNSHETPSVPATTLYTKEDDGLSKPWFGRVYLNPPYGSEIGAWTDRLVGLYELGEVEEAIALLPARIDTIWFQPLYNYPMCNIRGRLQFENSPYHAPFPCVIVYLGLRSDAFIEHFRSLGPIMRRIG